MNIAIFRTSCSTIDPQSYNCQEIGLAKALVEYGNKVSVVLGGGSHSHYTDSTGVDIYILPYKALNQAYGIMIGYEEILAKIEPDVIQIHEIGLFMSYKVSKWAKSNGVPVALVQGPYELSKKTIVHQLHSLFNVIIGKKILANVSALGVKTKLAYNFLKQYTDKTILITPVGLDSSPFSSEETVDWGAKIDKSKNTLLYVGKLEPRRNILFLLDILQLLCDDFNLLLVGTGESGYLEQIKGKIANLRLQNRVTLLGRVEQKNLPSLYKQADLFLLPSNYEIYGMVILESMYFSLPVISTRTAGADLIINQDNGLIIDELDCNKWALSIEEIIQNQKKRQSMKKKASEIIQNEYLWSKTAPKFIELYKRAINESTTSK